MRAGSVEIFTVFSAVGAYCCYNLFTTFNFESADSVGMPHGGKGTVHVRGSIPDIAIVRPEKGSKR